MKSLLESPAKRSVPASGPSLANPRQVAVSVNDWPGWSVSLVVGCEAAPGPIPRPWRGRWSHSPPSSR